MISARDRERLADHLERPRGRGRLPDGGHTGAAGGAACGDLVRISLALDGEDAEGRIVDAGFDASGCGAASAAGSAAVALVSGVPLLDAARIGAGEIAAELGGLSAGKMHAAELAADALHRALGAAARQTARLAHHAGRTLVALSGGVDSAVAALLVARDGGEALGVTLELWAEGGNAGAASCCSAEAVRSARRLAHELGMPHFSIDLRTEFKAGVVERWLAEQASGLTPNPCVRCNGSVRLDAMLEIAERLGARSLATGHYARIRGGAVLATGADAAKDQSYTLCAVSADSLSRLRFPLGELSKQEVRRIAAEAGLAVASKRDSQDLCFLAGTRSAAFLERHLGVGGLAGPILDESGSRVGEHAGAHAYTVGQRRGLGIGGPEPLFVLATDTHANTVTVGPRSRLLSDRLGLRDVSLRLDGAGVDGVRMRAHGRTLGCRLAGSPAPGTHESLEVALAEAAERTAPGQVACLYAGELVAGYGTITAPQRSRT